MSSRFICSFGLFMHLFVFFVKGSVYKMLFFFPSKHLDTWSCTDETSGVRPEVLPLLPAVWCPVDKVWESL